ncbi:hypothetical protein EVAR_48817_1 [Eumeta japonica]|uniref:Uncharacterized protein n=1 Tax=Eumeta variegata TaxID=151549 RepID=A0A4C1Y4J3_EUMVA|nr:hypothetical protein EVAR_48817_1 [Eumeta japonica]
MYFVFVLHVTGEFCWNFRRLIPHSASGVTVEKDYVRKVKYKRDIPFVKGGNYAHRVMGRVHSSDNSQFKIIRRHEDRAVPERRWSSHCHSVAADIFR